MYGNLIETCAKCSMCSAFIPDHVKRFRNLYCGNWYAPILIVDDSMSSIVSEREWDWLSGIFGVEGFVYTNTIRCRHDIPDYAKERAIQFCSVYTKAFTFTQRSIIVTTKTGMEQLQIEKEFEAERAFQFDRYNAFVYMTKPLDEIFDDEDAMVQFEARMKKLMGKTYA